MAKTKEETVVETPNVPAVEADLWAGFSEEEIKQMRDVTGQSANFTMDRTPVLKINKFPVEDKEGRSVKLGNFVLGQVTKQEGENTTCENIGKDFGPNPEITVLKFGTKFSYFPKDKDRNKICQSQLVLNPGEIATGDKLGYACASGKCPRRAKDLQKDERCTCQYVAFVEVGPEREKALMYFKGTSFLPFKAYLDEAGKFPLFFFPTVLETERKINGTNVYWIINPRLQKDRPYPVEARKELFDTAKGIDEAVREFEAQRKLNNAGRSDAQAQIPAGMTVEQGTAVGMSSGIGAGAVDGDFDDIQF